MSDVEKIRTELPGFSYTDYLRRLGDVESDRGALKPLRVAVLRSYTAEAIEPVLRLRLFLEEFDGTVWFGDYNSYVPEILDTSSALYSFSPNLILLLIRIEELMPDFVDSFDRHSYAEWEELIESKAREIGGLVEKVREHSPAPVIVQNVCLPADVYWGIYDSQRPDGQAHLVSSFNRLLARMLSQVDGAYVWDFARFVQKQGYDEVFDPKAWWVSKNPYKQSVYPSIVDDLAPYVLSVLGKSKKCIVLDLDNTLWGGVVGEDGLENIELGHTYPGNCFRQFQKELLKLHRRGVILAINSKNNEADAFDVIENHPDMILRRDHFSAWQINWGDKATNLQLLADDLNIGVDSMIFVDDNPVECELVRQQFPECAVIRVPERPYLIPDICKTFPGVENIRLTDEDRKKGQLYRDQVARKRHESAYVDLEEFLRSLDLEVVIRAADPFSIPRIAQLTQKTNQMNLTTRRYTEADISSLKNDAGEFAFFVSLKDRFGDNGIVGVIILRIEREECRIDTFLLSCRVIGRNIEHAMIAFIAEFARQRGAEILIGEYIPTVKNSLVSEMYGKFRFEQMSDSLFRADLSEEIFESPDYIDVIVD